MKKLLPWQYTTSSLLLQKGFDILLLGDLHIHFRMTGYSKPCKFSSSIIVAPVNYAYRKKNICWTGLCTAYNCCSCLLLGQLALCLPDLFGLFQLHTEFHIVFKDDKWSIIRTLHQKSCLRVNLTHFCHRNIKARVLKK